MIEQEKSFDPNFYKYVATQEFVNKIFKNLTKQQKKVMYYYLNGYKDKKIGETLFISSSTVKTHRCNSLKALKIKTDNFRQLYIYFMHKRDQIRDKMREGVHKDKIDKIKKDMEDIFIQILEEACEEKKANNKKRVKANSVKP